MCVCVTLMFACRFFFRNGVIAFVYVIWKSLQANGNLFCLACFVVWVCACVYINLNCNCPYLITFKCAIGSAGRPPCGGHARKADNGDKQL